MAADLLEDLADELVQIRVDLTQYSETYYFRDGEESASLAATIGTAVRLGWVAERSARADLRFAGKLLDTAVGDFAGRPDEHFLRVGGPPQAVLSAYTHDRGHPRRGWADRSATARGSRREKQRGFSQRSPEVRSATVASSVRPRRSRLRAFTGRQNAAVSDRGVLCDLVSGGDEPPAHTAALLAC
jgi:hypothetical protein